MTVDLQTVIWAATTLVGIGVTYGVAQTQINALKDDLKEFKDAQARALSEQLADLKSRLISIEQFLRNDHR